MTDGRRNASGGTKSGEKLEVFEWLHLRSDKVWISCGDGYFLIRVLGQVLGSSRVCLELSNSFNPTLRKHPRGVEGA